MAVPIDATVFGKALDTVNTVGKIAANLTDPKKSSGNNQNQNSNPPRKESTNTNQPHTQTVEVKVGNPDQPKEKPVVVHEKKETHIHKPYPDGRSLTKEECEVEKLRIQVAQQNLREEREYNLEIEERARKERKEKLEYERLEADRRREERKRQNRRARIVGYTLCGAGLVAAGYLLYSDYRDSRAARLSVPAPQNGTVKIEASRPRHHEHKPVPQPKPVKQEPNPNKSKPIKAEGTVK
jgi:hypothetical protein